MRYYLGVDPGKSGGFAIVDSRSRCTNYKKMGSDLDNHEWLQQYDIEHARLEKVNAMPGQGVTSMFSFGKNFGGCQMLLACHHISYDLMIPRSWQKSLGFHPIKGESRPALKERLRVFSQSLFPKLDLWSKTLGEQRAVCDALLIAESCRRSNTGR